MKELLGQNKINSKISRLNITTCPQSLILCGLKGCGKHTTVNNISEKLQLDVTDITTMLNNETIDDIYLNPQPGLYLIDIDMLVEQNKRILRNENVILKFLEEPPENAHIVILCQRLSQLITTVRNRCQIWEFETYNRDTLSVFLSKSSNLILDIAETPGKVMEYENYPLEAMLDICTRLLTKASVTGLSNLFVVSNMMNFEDKEWQKDNKYSKGDIVSYQSNRYECTNDCQGTEPTDKFTWRHINWSFNFTCFVELLVYAAKKLVVTETDMKFYRIAELTNSLFNNVFTANINKQTLFEHYLCQLKEV